MKTVVQSAKRTERRWRVPHSRTSRTVHPAVTVSDRGPLRAYFHKRIPLRQTEKILAKFGGPMALRNAMRVVGVRVDSAKVNAWIKQGFIPPKYWEHVFNAAFAAGIFITPEEFDPR